MKKIVASALAASAALAMSLTASAAERTGDEAAIEHVLRTYELALNAEDTDVVMKLYAPDGVFMPPNSPSSVGADAVRSAYVNVFKAIKLAVRFDIVEIVQVAPEWAFARTNSAGTVTVKASGQTGPEANQELFVLQKLGSGDWKIARYSFSTTNPPRQ
ncbi:MULTISPECIES: YybH family protein [Mesorhizobium]|uniref:YybH family protein n=1 Tax=Mesorhizobium TaxID=68287 RepID=UPI00197D1151|nr:MULTISPECIES: SgcJ/EcaC family oxidoreductase [Mesorhizobium]